MIIVRLIGGLGNQLFQYAAARRLAVKQQTSLKLDITNFAKDPLRTYSLAPFRTQAAPASSAELNQAIGPQDSVIGKFLFRARQALPSQTNWTVLREARVGPLDERVLLATGNIYLNGYWQSEKYFDDIADAIREELTVRLAPDACNGAMIEAIQNAEAVSIHIRRGDYVSNPHTNRVHGTCSLDYYQQCVRQICDEIHNPHFFIFSDDQQWVKDNLQIARPTTFVDHNSAATAHEDLRLMSLCKHHIVANSSFSWWGAWLNPSPTKIVYAPQRWYNDPTVNTRDVVPSSWRRV